RTIGMVSKSALFIRDGRIGIANRTSPISLTDDMRGSALLRSKPPTTRGVESIAPTICAPPLSPIRFMLLGGHQHYVVAFALHPEPLATGAMSRTGGTVLCRQKNRGVVARLLFGLSGSLRQCFNELLPGQTFRVTRQNVIRDAIRGRGAERVAVRSWNPDLALAMRLLN